MTSNPQASVTISPVKMKDGSTKLKLVSPYTPTLAPKLRNLGGRWNASAQAWYIDPRDADDLRRICVEEFGIDPLAEPDETPDLVTVRVRITYRYEDADAPANGTGAEVFALGRTLVRRSFRDARAQLGHGVKLVSGGFPDRGGSARYPELRPESGTVVEVRDVPRPLAEAFVTARPKLAEIVETADAGDAVQLAAQAAARRASQQPAPESELDRVWKLVAALPEADRVEIRNRLLAEL